MRCGNAGGIAGSRGWIGRKSARRIGLRIDRVVVLGYIACSLFAALGAVMLMVQIGVGDPRQGVSYTLSSITAVGLGGTSLRGGRGSFIGAAIGALLLTEVLNVVAFLGLSQSSETSSGRAHPDRCISLLGRARTHGRLITFFARHHDFRVSGEVY